MFSSTDESDALLVRDCLRLRPQAYPMERNTIELTAHTAINIDETGVHNKTVIEVSIAEEGEQCLHSLKGLTIESDTLDYTH